jgi:hypothetical protein
MADQPDVATMMYYICVLNVMCPYGVCPLFIVSADGKRMGSPIREPTSTVRYPPPPPPHTLAFSSRLRTDPISACKESGKRIGLSTLASHEAHFESVLLDFEAPYWWICREKKRYIIPATSNWLELTH